MKKTVLTWGLFSGAVVSAVMLATLRVSDRFGFDKGELLGYTTLVLSSLLVFFGVRSYRDTAGSGRITFGRGLKVGLGIVVVSSLCYVATWQVVYFKFTPDFWDKYTAHLVERERKGGASPEALEEIRRKSAEFKTLYDNPAINAALTFLEPFPIGLLAALVSAAALRRS